MTQFPVSQCFDPVAKHVSGFFPLSVSPRSRVVICEMTILAATQLAAGRNKRLISVLWIIVCTNLVITGCPGGFDRMPRHITWKLIHFQNGAWTPGPNFPDGRGEYKVSSENTLWMASSSGGLSRLDGNRWTHFGKTEFGAPTDWLRGGFALRGKEVWGATDQGVVRFDGQHWHFYKSP